MIATIYNCLKTMYKEANPAPVRQEALAGLVANFVQQGHK